MNRYIDADNLIEYSNNTKDKTIDANDIARFPVADVRENVRGKWIPVTNGRGGNECDKCHAYAPSYQTGEEHLTNFCPNCGADMRQGSTDRDMDAYYEAMDIVQEMEVD